MSRLIVLTALLLAAPALAAEAAKETPPAASKEPAAEAKMAPPEDATHLRCIVVQSRLTEDKKSTVIYLDKGHKAKLKKGQKGALLKNAKGDELLEGGEFTMTMVVDSWNSLARIDGAVKIPKHHRCYVDLSGP